jgi:hypothetical protein
MYWFRPFQHITKIYFDSATHRSALISTGYSNSKLFYPVINTSTGLRKEQNFSNKVISLSLNFPVQAIILLLQIILVYDLSSKSNMTILIFELIGQFVTAF